MQVHACGMVTIPGALLAQIEARARSTPEVEVCGLLLGKTHRVEAARHTRNVAVRPQDSFEVDPGELFAAMRDERTGGMRLLGHYHSHPNGSAHPSPRDAAAAEPGRLWLIVGAQESRLWLAEEGGFRPLALHAV